MWRQYVRVITWALCLLAALVSAAAASDRVPAECEIYQNTPNPFCAAPWGEQTEIRFDVPSPMYLRIVVGSPDTVIVMRTLIHGNLSAGNYVIAWDGRDDWDGYMTGGRYPYLMQVRDPDTGRWSRVRKLVLTIDCTCETEIRTWGRIKALYRSAQGADV
jgi:hypothetical protein